MSLNSKSNRHSEGVPKIRGTFLGVPIIRALVVGVYIGVAPILGKYNFFETVLAQPVGIDTFTRSHPMAKCKSHARTVAGNSFHNCKGNCKARVEAV